MSIDTAIYSKFFRHFALRLVAFVAAFAVALPVVPFGGSLSNTAQAGQKRSGGAKTHGGSGVRKMRVKRSGASHRTVSRSVRVTSSSSGKKFTNSGKVSRRYNVRRSVLDSRGHRSVRKGKMHNVKRYGGQRQAGTGEKRSGVRLSRTTDVTTTSVTGLREVAGSRSAVKKVRLGNNRHQKGHRKGHKAGRHLANGFSASGTLVVVVEGAHSSAGLQEIAGNGSGMTDCAYGSYCTIDLGGPKIITYNDVADISDGDIADEDLTDEEYYEKYGSK